MNIQTANIDISPYCLLHRSRRTKPHINAGTERSIIPTQVSNWHVIIRWRMRLAKTRKSGAQATLRELAENTMNSTNVVDMHQAQIKSNRGHIWWWIRGPVVVHTVRVLNDNVRVTDELTSDFASLWS